MCDDADRPLEAIETEMRLQASRIMHGVSLYVNLRRPELVVRGRIELPTFRFSVLRITVQSRPPRFIFPGPEPQTAAGVLPRTNANETGTETEGVTMSPDAWASAKRHSPPAGRASSSRHAVASSRLPTRLR